MKIADVKPGQTVFIRAQRYNGTTIRESVVKRVGRKYVTLDDPHESRFCEDYESRPHLVERGGYGAIRQLYLSRADVEADIEAEKLRQWLLKTCSSWAQMRKYTLEQLQAVKQILGGEEHGSD